MTAHAVFITHRTKPGQRAGAAAVWTKIMQPAIRANPNHLAYVYVLPDDEPDVIRAFQLYRSASDASAFLSTAEYLDYSAAVEPYLEGAPLVVSSPAAWVKENL